MRLFAFMVALSAFCAIGAHASPDTTPDSTARVVYLRTDCNVASTPLDNCFETMSSLSNPSTGWIWNTRNPTASSPLIVEIGPGTFGKFECPNGRGHVTLRGSGREQTIIADDYIAIAVLNCQDLTFIDLGARAGEFTVNWLGSGFSTWSNTDILLLRDAGTPQLTTAWSDTCDFSINPPTYARSKHYFHGTRVRAIGAGQQVGSAFYSSCGENWFFGGEIEMQLSNSSFEVAAVRIPNSRGDLRVFGTAIRAWISSASASVTQAPLRGVWVRGGMFHSHGAVVNVNAAGSSSNEDVVGLVVREDVSSVPGHAHTPETAFVLTPSGSGTATRVTTANGGVAESPYLWEPRSSPPAISSQDGSDLFVETDCDSTGDCDAAGDETHLMVFNSALCGSDPWFDVVTGRCRGDTNDPVAETLSEHATTLQDHESRITDLEGP